MNFSIEKSIEILACTPDVLQVLLQNLSDDWVFNNEGGDSWSPYDVVGHLIHGERTDWIPRLEIILSDRADKLFEPFDRFAQLGESKDKTLPQLLETFRLLRQGNLEMLRSMEISEKDFGKKGLHPAFGEVTLSQLLATWTVHDLGHIAQISRAMAKQYTAEVGPWVEYLGVLKR